MIRRFTAALLGLLAAVLACAPALGQEKPAVIVGGVAQTIPANHYLLLRPATTGNASINLPHGTAPTSPNNGDCWTTTASLYCRINGLTVDMGAAGGSTTFIGLTDVPASFTGASLKWLRVNSGETALEFITPGYFALGTDAANLTGTVASARVSGSYTGITGVGTLTVGTWNATAVTVPYGGTGQTTLGNHCVLIGAGTGGFNTACPNSSGKLLTDNGASADPTFQTPAASSTCANPCTIGAAGVQQITGTPSSALAAGYISEETAPAQRAWFARLPDTTVPVAVQQGTAAGSYAITLPGTPTVGDVFFAFCYRSSSLPVKNTGWVDLPTPASHNQVSSDPYAIVVEHVVVGGDTTAQTPCTGTADAYGAAIQEMSGIDPIIANSIQAAVTFNQVTSTGQPGTTLTATTSAPNTVAVNYGSNLVLSTGGWFNMTENVGFVVTATGATNANATSSNAVIVGTQTYVSTSSSVTATATSGHSTGFTTQANTQALLLLQPPASASTGSLAFVLQTKGATPAAGQIAVYSADGIVDGQTVSGDCTASATLAFTCFASGFPASGLTGNIAAARMSTNLAAAFDTSFCSSRGSVLYRGASGWVCLAPSTVGYSLTTNGAGADPTWSNVGGGGGGGVTQVNTDAPWTSGGPITTTGTVTAGNYVKAMLSGIVSSSFGGF